MSRFDKLKNWPENLEQLTEEQLERELKFWRRRVGELKHSISKREASGRAETIAEVIARRFGGAT
jgi:hypothetical protein